jgi:hypothetical protein
VSSGFNTRDVKGKAVPLTPRRRQGGEELLTSALDAGQPSASRSGRALPLGKGPPVPIVQEAGWAPEPVWTQEARGKTL